MAPFLLPETFRDGSPCRKLSTLDASMTKIIEHDAVTGITSTTHYLDDKVVFQKTYDAKPFLDTAAEMRSATDGESWGEMRHVGFIPMAEMGKMLRQDGGIDQKRMIAWLRANPALATFSRVLK